jgi:hypothetical protein
MLMHLHVATIATLSRFDEKDDITLESLELSGLK